MSEKRPAVIKFLKENTWCRDRPDYGFRMILDSAEDKTEALKELIELYQGLLVLLIVADVNRSEDGS
jgi:hypothetical protein